MGDFSRLNNESYYNINSALHNESLVYIDYYRTE